MSASKNLLIAVPVLAIALIVSRPSPYVGSPADRSEGDLPLADTPYALADEIEAYADFMMSGGPPPDGIPAIDDPQFSSAEEADLEPG